jgi:hypothetical protein
MIRVIIKMPTVHVSIELIRMPPCNRGRHAHGTLNDNKNMNQVIFLVSVFSFFYHTLFLQHIQHLQQRAG